MDTETKNDTNVRAKELYRLLKSCQADIQDMVLNAALQRRLNTATVQRSGKPVQRIIGKFAARSRRRARGRDIYTH